MEQIDDGIGLLGAIAIGRDYGDKDILVHAVAPDGNLLLVEGKVASCYEQEHEEGNDLLWFHILLLLSGKTFNIIKSLPEAW